jgi:hypothetical protein
MVIEWKARGYRERKLKKVAGEKATFYLIAPVVD